MANITISVQDLGLFILFCLAVAVGIFLIIALININKTVKRVNVFMDANSSNIKETLEALPKTAKSLDEAALNIKENVEKIGGVVDTVEGAVTETAAVVSDKTEGILDAVNLASNIVKIILNAFSTKDKN